MSVCGMVEFEKKKKQRSCSFVLFEVESCCVDQSDLKLKELSLSGSAFSPLKMCRAGRGAVTSISGVAGRTQSFFKTGWSLCDAPHTQSQKRVSAEG